MNFLFALSQGVFLGLALLVVLVLIEAMTSKKIPFDIKFWAPLLVVVITAYFSAQTYGPRLQLEAAQRPPTPTVTEVDKGSKMIDNKDRSKIFSDQLEN